MSFPYKKILIIGATSGIGLALAERFIAHGIHVIVTGRRAAHLASFVSKHGSHHASSCVLDIANLSAIPPFAASITQQHPDIDSVLLNAGMQRGFDFSRPTHIDLALVEEELRTNYLASIHLTTALLPHLQALQSAGTPTSLIYTTSALALVPLPRCANYCASKAALHHFILCLREQLRAGGDRREHDDQQERDDQQEHDASIKVIEIIPPAVQTELHDPRHQPDLAGAAPIGMPLDDFADAAWAMLRRGEEQVPVGMGRVAFDAFEGER